MAALNKRKSELANSTATDSEGNPLRGRRGGGSDAPPSSRRRRRRRRRRPRARARAAAARCSSGPTPMRRRARTSPSLERRRRCARAARTLRPPRPTLPTPPSHPPTPLTTPLTTPALLPHMSFRPPPLLPHLPCPTCPAPSPARDHETSADHSDPAYHNAHRTRRLTARTLLTSPHPARSNKRC